MKQIFTKNGNGHNGATNGATNGANPPSQLVPLNGSSELAAEEIPSARQIKAEAFDQPVILQQSSTWAKGIVWGIVGVTSAVLLWAAVARIEEAVPAAGKLEPQAKVQEIQAPVGGVVKEILVEDGQTVSKGQVLIRFDPTTAEAQRRSLQQIRDTLTQENQFYRNILAGIPVSTQTKVGNIPPELLSLTANRSALLAENNLYRAQLTGAPGAGMTAEQRIRLQAGQLEAQSRAAAARLEVAQLQQQLSQTEAQLVAARQTYEIDETIMNNIRQLAEEGGIARVQYQRQQQEAIKGQAEVDRLTQEKSRIQLQIAQAAQKFENTVAVTSTDILGRMADNEKRIAEIDSQINKAIVDNQKQISEIDSQLSQANQTLQYQELRSPIDGVVFDLKAKGIGFVANTSEPVLKIVPSNSLVAEVYVTNKDIGFVSEGMPVDVRIDSFPFSEFGDIKGELLQIGDDALPPDQVNPYYRFPATIKLDNQTLDVNGKQIPLQSGMSVTANIITRDRTVLSIFTDLFSRRIESIKTVR